MNFLTKSWISLRGPRQYISENPISHIQKLKVDERRLFFFDTELKRVFTLIDRDIQQAGMKKSVIVFRRTFKLLVEFLLSTGLRREESLRLRWSDVDMANNIICVAHTKTKQMRLVPLNETARRVLSEVGPDLFARLN